MSRLNAERHASALTLLGYASRIEPYEDANRVRWFRVRIGKMNSLALAHSATAQLRSTVSETVIPVSVPA